MNASTAISMAPELPASVSELKRSSIGWTAPTTRDAMPGSVALNAIH